MVVPTTLFSSPLIWQSPTQAGWHTVGAQQMLGVDAKRHWWPWTQRTAPESLGNHSGYECCWSQGTPPGREVPGGRRASPGLVHAAPAPAQRPSAEGRAKLGVRRVAGAPPARHPERSGSRPRGRVRQRRATARISGVLAERAPSRDGVPPRPSHLPLRPTLELASASFPASRAAGTGENEHPQECVATARLPCACGRGNGRAAVSAYNVRLFS